MAHCSILNYTSLLTAMGRTSHVKLIAWVYVLAAFPGMIMSQTHIVGFFGAASPKVASYDFFSPISHKILRNWKCKATTHCYIHEQAPSLSPEITCCATIHRLTPSIFTPPNETWMPYTASLYSIKKPHHQTFYSMTGSHCVSIVTYEKVICFRQLR